MYDQSSYRRTGYSVCSVLRSCPHAYAVIAGSADDREISGTVRFYQTDKGVILYAEIKGLPKAEIACGGRIFGFHIHEGTACSGDMADPFANAKSHYNPEHCAHPYHAGDLPPLFGCGGYAFCVFLTDRFALSEVIGKAIIIHDRPDDFTSQPSGNSGEKIACGIIRQNRK